MSQPISVQDTSMYFYIHSDNCISVVYWTFIELQKIHQDNGL